jgi:glycerate dehydrogenase
VLRSHDAGAALLPTLLLNRHRLDFDQALALGQLESRASLASLSRADQEAIQKEDCPTQTVVDIIERGIAQHWPNVEKVVLVSKEQRLNAEIVRALPRSVHLICEAGTGYDNINLAAAKARGIRVCNVPGYSTAAVAQLAMSYILGIASGTLGCVRRVAEGNRADFPLPTYSPFEVAGKVLGVVGAGAIGREVAFRALDFGMTVLAFNRKPRRWRRRGMRAASLEEIYGESDFVTLHCPLDVTTHHLISTASLAAMGRRPIGRRKPWLVNTSRGGLVDQAALVAALRAGLISGAALDVQDPDLEQGSESVLWTEPSAFLTPHVGWKAVEARERLMREVGENILAFECGSARNVLPRRRRARRPLAEASRRS